MEGVCTAMRLVTVKLDDIGTEEAAIIEGESAILVRDINAVCHTEHPVSLFQLLVQNALSSLQESWAGERNKFIASQADRLLTLADCDIAPLYRHPRKIWGIGLNYKEHAGDLSAQHPTDEPASFMKADTTIIGPNDTIVLPKASARVTAEAELAVVIGRVCKDVDIDNAEAVIAGYTTVIDMTAEDILQKNPRFLTRAKNFDTFFSFGSEFVTPDELPKLSARRVTTWRNGEPIRENIVGNMTFSPDFLVAFHSQVMTLLPGDIISTGTPGAVVIEDGDEVVCTIDGMRPLQNSVARKSVRIPNA